MIVIECARCGQDHEIEETRFKGHYPNIEGVIFNKWATCPNTNEPILIREF